MDRTIIAPYRAEEKELCQVLYNKLLGLALLHPMSEDLKKLLSDEMFIKPNQQAFFHVMHYLFRLIDQHEFKKRFYWPITDKKSESNFRSSTVDYLKYLKEKHQLNWTNIKSYLVVMPGGMKFISFILDFVHFIVKELIKQKEKQLNLDSTQQQEMLTVANIQKMCKQDSLFKEMAAVFIESIEVINKSRQSKMEDIKTHVEQLADTTGMCADSLTDDTFLSEFEESNSNMCQQNFVDRTDKICEVEKRVFKLKAVMDTFFCKDAGFKSDKQKLRLQLRKLHEEFSLKDMNEESLSSDNCVSVSTLIRTFNGIAETIQNELEIIDKRPRAGIVHTRLLDIQNDLKGVEMQITKFLMVIKSKVKKRQEFIPRTPVRMNALNERNRAETGDCSKRTLENALLMKYVATPPIKLDIPGGHHGPSRLSLIDAKITGNTTNTFGSFLAPPRNVRYAKLNGSIADQSTMELNNTINRSKLIDPMQLLRSINKDASKVAVTTPRANISSLGSRWKERQSLLSDKENEYVGSPKITLSSECNPRTIHKKTFEPSLPRPLFPEMDEDISSSSTLVKKSFGTSGSSTILQSPMTPFSSNDHTRIARSQLQILEQSSFTTSATANSWSCVKKLSAVKKVQDASLNFANLSTSPSGRLEPLVTAEDFNIPKIKLNDSSLIDHNESIVTGGVGVDYSIREEVEARTEANCSGKTQTQCDEDAIFNISDSILKDVPI